MGLTLVRRIREQRITPMQKFFMRLIGIIIAGSFVMVCLQAAGIVSSDYLIFSHILLSMMSAIGGYLFGSNIKTQIPSGDS